VREDENAGQNNIRKACSSASTRAIKQAGSISYTRCSRIDKPSSLATHSEVLPPFHRPDRANQAKKKTNINSNLGDFFTKQLREVGFCGLVGIDVCSRH
jgi:hypothetical protein